MPVVHLRPAELAISIIALKSIYVKMKLLIGDEDARITSNLIVPEENHKDLEDVPDNVRE